MRLEKTLINGLYLINQFNVLDDRGNFVKIFHEPSFIGNEINFNVKESYYSISKKNVIRGMHFQTPPHEHEKLVYVSSGAITDVVIDLRKESPTYKKHLAFELSAKNKRGIYIPKGCAHGFLSLMDESCVVYMVSSPYSEYSDSGILYNSFGYDWGIDHPIISSRDMKFPFLESFDSPFL